MNPELTALARAYMALPGTATPDRVRFARDRRGMMWVVLPDDADGGQLRWFLNLSDTATGGVMLDALGEGDVLRGGGIWRVTVDDETSGDGATLAEAVARVASAVGRAG